MQIKLKYVKTISLNVVYLLCVTSDDSIWLGFVAFDSYIAYVVVRLRLFAFFVALCSSVDLELSKFGEDLSHGSSGQGELLNDTLVLHFCALK